MTGRIIISLVLLAVVALSFSGCAGQRVQPETGELVRLWDEPSSLDPHLARDADSAVILVEVFGGLLTMDTNLKVVPDLAESWTVSPDGRTYTFSLRRDARFHNGKPVTADDVKWSLERPADPKTQSATVDTYLGDIVGVREKLRGEASEVTGIKVIDASTVAITIDSPKTYFISKLTYPTAFILDRENVESGPQWFKTPNGTGPFKLKEYVPGNRIILEANTRYHLGQPTLKRVRFLLSGGQPMIMYENNEIYITGVELADLKRLRNSTSPLKEELHRGPPGFQLSYLGMNVVLPPFDDVKVRQALAHAIPKDAIATKILEDLVVPAYGILPPGFPGYNPGLKGLRYDLAEAKKLLAESRYGPDPRNLPRITLTVPGSLGAIVGVDLQAILATWRDSLGINVEIRQMEFATFLTQLNVHRLQMYALAWIADYPDPQNFLDLLFHSHSLNNETGYVNPEVDRLLEAARAERDEQTRFRLYQQAEQIIANEVPVIPLWHASEGYVLVKPFVKDYLLLPLIVPKYRYTAIVK
ncbi:MAG: peptide ABC transporter substrate-binding protein [Chloroflexi bacterium]|nr:peptide ABC transporter substrate-binding protein [Chloroflexota bacterium]